MAVEQYHARRQGGTGPRRRLWRARWRDPAGRSRSKSGFRTRAEAEAYLADLRVARARGAEVDVEAARRDLATYHATWRAAQAVACAPSTLARYDGLWRAHVAPAWGETPVGRITRPLLQQWVTDLTAAGLSPSSARQAVGVMRGALTAAVDAGALARNPATGLRLPTPRHTEDERAFLTGPQCAALIREVRDPAMRALAAFLIGSGARFGEAIALQPRDRIAAGRWRIERALSSVGGRAAAAAGPTKTHQRREVAVPPPVDRMVAAYVEARGLAWDSREWIWRAPGGGPVRVPNAGPGQSSWLAGAVRRCQAVDPTFPARLRAHDLRHTHASLAIAAGASPVAVARQLGHRSPSLTLDVYGHLYPDDAERVAEAVGGLLGDVES